VAEFHDLPGADGSETVARVADCNRGSALQSAGGLVYLRVTQANRAALAGLRQGRGADGDAGMSIRSRMRRAVWDRRYIVSFHANEESSDDRFTTDDIKRILLKGDIARTFTDDPRGTRYEVVGEATDGRQAAVVCRFLPMGRLLVITVYEREG